MHGAVAGASNSCCLGGPLCSGCPCPGWKKYSTCQLHCDLLCQDFKAHTLAQELSEAQLAFLFRAAEIRMSCWA